jgi:hypothetical protein
MVILRFKIAILCDGWVMINNHEQNFKTIAAVYKTIFNKKTVPYLASLYNSLHNLSCDNKHM